MEAALLALTLAVAAGEGGKESVLWSRLRGRLEAIERGLDGVLGVAVKDLKADRSLEIRAHEAFPAASTIKLAILYDLYCQAEEGRVDLAEITRPPLPRVGGSGALQWLGDRVSLTWRDLASLMIGFSDNEATNLLLARLGAESVNRRMVGLGLEHTRLRRRMMDLEAARRGEENLAAPAELVRLIEVLHQGVGLSPDRARDLAAVASTPESATPLRAPLPPGLKVIAKSGELEGVRAEVGLVDLPNRPYAVAVMTTYLRRDADGETAIREISAAVHETFDRLARSSAHGRIIGGR